MTEIKWTIKKFADLSNLELFEIARLRIEVFVTEQKITEPELDDVDLTAYHVFGTAPDGTIVAVSRFFFEDGKLLVGRVAVKESYRREHLGSKMMGALEEYVKDNQLTDAIYLHAQLYIKDFYANLGYEVAGPVFYEAGIDHVMMKKEV